MKRTKCDAFQDGSGKMNASLFSQISAPLLCNEESFMMHYDCCKKQLLPALSQRNRPSVVSVYTVLVKGSEKAYEPFLSLLM